MFAVADALRELLQPNGTEATIKLRPFLLWPLPRSCIVCLPQQVAFAPTTTAVMLQ
jgi:hypothetical protein